MARTRRMWRDRGATLVEYSLIVALFVVATAGALEALTAGASDEYVATGERIGAPNPTLPPDYTPPGAPDPDPVTPPSPQRPPVVAVGCSTLTCSFTLELPTGVSVDWSSTPGGEPAAGEGAGFSPAYPEEPGRRSCILLFICWFDDTTTTYTVRATPSNGTDPYEWTVRCTGSDGPNDTTCTAVID